jgi:imidazolonepropionase-like amidohydrolase
MNPLQDSTIMRIFKTSLFSTLVSAIFVCSAFAQSDGGQQNVIGEGGTFAIVGAKIVPVSGPVISNGTIVISNGKITAVGAAVAVPANAVKIAGAGLSVYPGMIDAGTNMGLSEIGQGASGTVDVSETGDNNANARAITGINPNTSHINVTRVNGITTVLSHPTGGTISGQAAVINLIGATQSEMALVPEFGLVINFPRAATGGGFGGFGGFGGGQVDLAEAVRRRDQKIDELKRLFRDAEAYAKVREAYAKDKTLPSMSVDLKLEAMVPYVRGQKPVIFVAERDRDIKAVIKFVEDMKLKGIIIGGQDAWKSADGLKKNNIAVIYTNMFALPVQDDDAYDYMFEAPAKMQKAGIRFAISTGEEGGNVRDLPYQAGVAGAFGLSPEEVLKSVTLYPAQILGIDDKVGTLDAGKIANVVVADGDILEPTTNIKELFINGRRLPLTSRHTDLYRQFKDRK